MPRPISAPPAMCVINQMDDQICELADLMAVELQSLYQSSPFSFMSLAVSEKLRGRDQLDPALSPRHSPSPTVWSGDEARLQ